MYKFMTAQAVLTWLWPAASFGNAFGWDISDPKWLSAAARKETEIRCTYAGEMLSRIRYPDIPEVSRLHLPERAPIPLINSAVRSHGLCSPVLEEARELSVFPDFKYLSDLRPKNLSPADRELVVQRVKARSRQQCNNRKNCNSERDLRKLFLKNYIDSVYHSSCELAYFVDPLTYPRWEIRADKATNEAFRYVEEHWYRLVKINPVASESTLLLNPYPFLIPAGRFKEAYYWDSYFGLEGLFATKRNELARMMAENILFNIRRFGFVPNGQRDYYLSRSQAPFSALIVRRVVQESYREYLSAGNKERADFLKEWVRKRALPLLSRELHDFWMNPETRFDKETGLHHHWDALNIKRPERHSSDHEAGLGQTFRDVRALAESGLDFTEAFSGPSGKSEITGIASVLLNTMLYRYMKDLEWLSGFVSDEDSRNTFAAMAMTKKTAMNRYLWSPSDGFYQPYNLRLKKRIRALSASAFAPMFAEMSSREQAKKIMESTRPLWKRGGLAASTFWSSPHQWDGKNGWAPYQMLAAEAMLRYGYREEARDLAKRWTGTLSKIYEKHRGFYERADLETQDLPADNKDKYPVQEGFLWTNASFVWMLTVVLKLPLYERAGPGGQGLSAVAGFPD